MEKIVPQNDPNINHSSISTTQEEGNKYFSLETKRASRIPSRYRGSYDESQNESKLENKSQINIVKSKDNSIKIHAQKYKRMREINNKSSKQCLENKRNKNRELAREENELLKKNIELRAKEAFIKSEIEDIFRRRYQ